MKKIFLVSLLALMVVLIAGCIQGPQGPQGDRGDSGPAGAFIQGPNRVVVYQNYMMVDVAAEGNGTIFQLFNDTDGSAYNATGYQPDYPRSVTLNQSQGGTTTAVIYGYDSMDNKARTETLTLVGNNYRVNGSVAWYNVTNITWYNASGVYMNVSAGWGAKFGLPNLIKGSSDLLGVSISSVGTLRTNHTVNITYNTIDFAPDPTGTADYSVFYRGYGVIPP